jgi:hypothetical protein
MRHEEVGHTEPLAEVRGQVEDDGVHGDIERRGRLVEDQQRGAQRRARKG